MSKGRIPPQVARVAARARRNERVRLLAAKTAARKARKASVDPVPDPDPAPPATDRPPAPITSTVPSPGSPS